MSLPRVLLSVLTILIAMLLLMSGCASRAPQPFIADFTDDKVHVSVSFDIFGPDVETAKASSRSVAVDQCRTFEKGAELVSSFRQPGRNYYQGNFVFLYRCVGPDTVRIEGGDSDPDF